MKIAFKLGAGFTIVVLLLVAAGLTGIITLKNVNSGYKVDVGLDNRARATAAMILVDMLQARQSEKDFFLSRDLTYFESVRRYLDKALADAEILSHLVTNSDVRSKLKEIKVATAGYRGSFVALVEAYRLRGLTEETGLLADFQRSANELQQFMQKNDVERYADGLLQMRSLLSELILNKGAKERSVRIYNALRLKIDYYALQIKESDVDPQLKEEMLNRANVYSASLSEWFNGLPARVPGSLARLRSSAQAFEAAVSENSIRDGEALYLMMRKEEKDYLLRGDAKFRDGLVDAAHRLRENIRTSRLNEPDRARLITLLAGYESGFLALVRKDAEIAGLEADMARSSGQVMKLACEIAALAAKTAERRTAGIDAAAADASRFVWLISVVSVIIAFVFAYLFSRSLARPISQTIAMIESLEQGNLDARLRVERKDEIGRLAMAMNAFAATFQTSMIAIAWSNNERDRAEAELRASEAKYRGLSSQFQTLLDGIPNALSLISPAMEVIWNNCKAEQLLQGAPLLGLTSPDDYATRDGLAQAESPLRNCFITGREEEWAERKADGRIFEVRAFPIIDDNGGVTSVIRWASDITEKVRMREETLQSSRLASLGELAAGVAHEINNPVGMIMMNIRLLRDVYEDIKPVLDERYQADGSFSMGGVGYERMRDKLTYLLGEMDDGARRIKRIVEDLKGFARPEQSDHYAAVNLNETLQTAVRLVTSTLEKSTERFVESYGENLPLARGNAQQIEQVVINLLMNACQALPGRERGVFLSTCLDPEGEMTVVEVRDEGYGVDADLLPRITDPFFTTKRELGGTGIGLSLSARIVREHGGNIHFYSRPGEGMTVTLKLPVFKEETRS